MSRTDVRYWQKKLTKPSDGKGGACKDYGVQIQFQKRRVRFALKTPNKEAAAKRAQKIYLDLAANGWDFVLEKYKGDQGKKKQTATIGSFLRAAKAVAKVAPRTFNDYSKALRRIVSDIERVKTDETRFDYVNGGTDCWRAKIDRVELAKINSRKIQEWMNQFVEPVLDDPIKLQSRKNTANSYVRQAKSLFSPKIIDLLPDELVLPEELPFEKVSFFRRSSTRYNSKFDADELVSAAVLELGSPPENDPCRALKREMLKVFLLAICAGLRRGEIDSLLWRQFLPELGIIRIEKTEYFSPKTEESAGDVEIDLELVELLKEFQSKPSGEFVIESAKAAVAGSSYDRTRADKVFEALYAWLREKGIKEQKPLHTLRKEFGSIINLKYGLYAASRALRHTGTTITSAHYLDKKERVTVNLGLHLENKEGRL